MRAIDADMLMEQVKYIHQAVDTSDVNIAHHTGFHSATSQIQGLIACMPAIEVPRWIPVTERLPDTVKIERTGTEYSEAVNVLTSGRKVITAIFDGTDFIGDAEFWDAEDEEITHWTPVLLPLPDAPKDGDT